ncbi:glutaredoxin-2, mitochondrial-like [Saccostrea echinata]|uniref:glutaredoxin-2, mitochondrial-like n=1 Tax=Saccostrea echinata TaxID=191078 RepID=UPI002A81B3D7|nr:glutaredoxin-2, mitochondrial-like [Saccostrea echinata]
MGLNSSRLPTTLSHPQAKLVQQAISQNCVVIFSKTTCPFCVQTKEIFKNLGIPYEAMELNKHPDGQNIQSYLADITKARTVPRVFINGTCIGGATETKSLHQSGQLLELVSKCHNPQLEQVRR